MRTDSLQARVSRWRRRLWLATAILAFLAGDTALWLYGPPAHAIAILRALVAGDTRMIATGASFSVSAGSFATQNRAAAFAAALNASGLPILVRPRPDDGRYQVLVGPYVSTDEAEHAQRALAAWGLGEPRLVVDDTMRSQPQRAALFGAGDTGGDNVLIVAAAGMSSIVFEMRDSPREVESRRTSATTLDIAIGHVTDAGAMDLLSMPEGVVLAREVSVGSTEVGRAMRARLVVPEGVQSRVRLEGRRVYVDLAWPQPPWQVANRMPGPKGPGLRGEGSGPDTVARVVSDSPETYRERLNAVVARFEEIQPFLVSAAQSPEPDVLVALERSLDGLKSSLASVNPPPERVANHQSLLTSVVLAAGAVAPSFAGNREVAVHQAISMFDDATKQSQ
jgi:hypothetical protein